jgi:hypothetical protein
VQGTAGALSASSKGEPTNAPCALQQLHVVYGDVISCTAVARLAKCGLRAIQQQSTAAEQRLHIHKGARLQGSAPSPAPAVPVGQQHLTTAKRLHAFCWASHSHCMLSEVVWCIWNVKLLAAANPLLTRAVCFLMPLQLCSLCDNRAPSG